jgi:AraC family transcriptional regulator
MASAAQGFVEREGTAFLSIIRDNPQATESGQVRVDAAVSVNRDLQLAEAGELELGELNPGLHAVYRHVGSYKGLRDAWARMASLPIEGVKLRGPCAVGPRNSGDLGPEAAPSFEIYLNDPASTPEEELVTELYQPVELLR